MIPRALYAVAACASVVSSLSEGVLDGDPSPNLLDYASNVATAGGTSSDSLCEATVSDGRLVYPEARIDHQTSGHVDCVSRLQLSGWPSGYRFSVSGVSVSGFLQLDPGSYVEKIEVDFSYTGGSLVVASVSNAFGFEGTGYHGTFNTSLPFSGTGGRSSCDTTVSVLIEVFVSLAHEQVQVDDATPHYGTVGGDQADQALKVAFDAAWSKC